MSFVTGIMFPLQLLLFGATSSWFREIMGSSFLMVPSVLINCCGFSCAKPAFLAWGQELSWAPRNITQHPHQTSHVPAVRAEISLWELAVGQVCSIGNFLKEEAGGGFSSGQCGSGYHAWKDHPVVSCLDYCQG